MAVFFFSCDIDNIDLTLDVFKIAIVLALACTVSAKPQFIYSAPVAAAAPVVTATSSQYIARNYNGIAAAPVVAAAYTAPVATAAYTAPVAAAAYTAPVAAAYTAPAAAYASYYPYNAAAYTSFF